MVTALVARIIEDPQLQDEPINLSWTTTVGEVCIDIPRLLVEFSQVWNFLMEYRVSFLFTKGIFPKVFHDTGAFNVNPAYYNSTLLDLLVHDGGCVKHSFKMRKQMVVWCKKTRIPNEASAYQVDAALDFIDEMWTRQVNLLHFRNSSHSSRSNYSEGSQNENVEMRRETAQFILENNFVQKKQVLHKLSV